MHSEKTPEQLREELMKLVENNANLADGKACFFNEIATPGIQRPVKPKDVGVKPAR